jgi:acyl-homoserine lactone acylase PvdQ
MALEAPAAEAPAIQAATVPRPTTDQQATPGQLATVDQPATTAQPSAANASLAKSVTIYRDEWGVPHIDGPTDESVIFGFGYAQAEDYFWQVEDSYIKALGRYSEVHGLKGVVSDTIVRAFEVPKRSREDFKKLDDESQSMCRAFVGGLNYYLATHPEVKPRLIDQFEPWHMLAFSRLVVIEMGWGNVGVDRDKVPTQYEEVLASRGSNAWAVSPKRTKSGHAMLFCNPHQPYFGLGQFYEAHLRSGEGWNFTGATFFGSPLPTIGHNEHLGWSFTVNRPRLGSTWRVVFDDPNDPLNYRYDGGYRAADQWTDTIKVLRRGEMETRELTFRKTLHGPVVHQESENVYLAANIGKFYEAFAARQNLQMVRARNLDEFRQAMARLEFHIFNTVYADQKGNIYYLYNGIVPVRDPGLDWDQPLDGSIAKSQWQGIHTLDQLPQVLNPPSQYVQSCNQSPFTTTDVGNPALKDFPSYMVREKYEDKRRAMVSRMLLREMHDVSFDRWQRAAYDTTVYWAVIELPNYARQFERLKETHPQLAAKARPYFEHLLSWDRICTLDCTVTPLCVAWYGELYGDVYRSETLTPEFVGDYPRRFEALIKAAETLEKNHGDWKVRYGDVHRMQRHADVADLVSVPFSDEQPSLPSAGLNGPLGVVFNMFFTPIINSPIYKSQSKHYAVVGDSYVATIEFGPKIRGGSVLQFGSSGDPESPHFFDQAKLMSQRKFKPQWFYWDDVKAHAKRVYQPGE